MDNLQFIFLRLESSNLSDMKSALKTFLEANSSRYTFSYLDKEKMNKLYSLLFNILCNPTAAECYVDCLSCLRILFRDKTYLKEMITQDRFNTLLQTARLYNTQPTVCYSELSPDEFEVMLETEKCLCNLIYNSTKAQEMSHNNNSNILQSIVYKLRTYSDPHLPYQIKLYDLKLLFLITALCQDVRLHVKETLHGVTYLMEILDLILKTAGNENKRVYPQVVLNEDQVLLSCEVLKILFNLLCKSSMSNPMDEDDPICHRLVSFLRELLLCDTQPHNMLDLLQCHIINLLTTVSVGSLEQLCVIEGNDSNVDAVHVILNYLDAKLKETPLEFENVSPSLHVLIECARYNRNLRRVIKHKILPPLREVDVKKRPEEGNTLKAKLCRLLSSPAQTLRDLVAELLFVLCKENVGRMIKYTGYGNAAGMFASRGLLGQNSSGNNPNYSSSSEDSDTEEYLRYKNDINPITGVYDPPRPNAMEGMSEERKEYEAIQLVNVIDKLSQMGVVQPCRIGEDGKPTPVDHVLQLQEELPHYKRKN